MTSSAPVISVRDLGKRYRIWTHSKPTSLGDRIEAMLHFARGRADGKAAAPPLREEIWALRGVSFDVKPGEVLGVIGPNGAGKSTLLSILARITEPTEGRAEISGRVSSILEVGTGFHPELSGRDNVFLNGAVLGMSRAETAAKFDEIVDFSGVRDFIDMPVKRYSSGMYLRLAFAVTAHLDPDVLLLDEVLAVGDRAFQEKCLRRVQEITAAGRTVLFVSHDVNSVARLCERTLVVNDGRIVFSGPVTEAVERYLNSAPLGGGESAVAERQGTGQARIARLRVENADGGSSIVVGEPVSIHAEITADRALRGAHLELELGIHSASGGQYVELSTDLDPDDPLAAGVGNGTSIVCRIDELPLKPGPYSISASLKRLGELIDRVSMQGTFKILPGDFFGTGVLASDSLIAPVLVRHRWDVSEPWLEGPEATLGSSVVPGGTSQ